MTYNVFGGTLSLTQSINQSLAVQQCNAAVVVQASLLVSVAIKRYCGDVPIPQQSDLSKQHVSTLFTLSQCNYNNNDDNFYSSVPRRFRASKPLQNLRGPLNVEPYERVA